MSEVEHFMPILMEKEEEGTLSPILAHGGVRFMWIKHNNLYRILRASDPPADAAGAAVFSLLVSEGEGGGRGERPAGPLLKNV